jgi:hypothetical protein
VHYNVKSVTASGGMLFSSWFIRDKWGRSLPFGPSLLFYGFRVAGATNDYVAPLFFMLFRTLHIHTLFLCYFPDVSQAIPVLSSPYPLLF